MIYRNCSIKEVQLRDGYLKPRQDSCRTVTVPSSLEKCRTTGRIDALKLDWREPMENKPHIFWDSDVAKVLEGVAYLLGQQPDEALAAEFDEIVGRLTAAQQPDGYLNSYFTTVEPDKRWTNLHEAHELYCAGHLLEAAVAAKEMLGRQDFLDTMCRYMDYIATVFGPGEGQKRGYPGHEEIELALVRLYELTGRKKYLDLAAYFIDERGREPQFFRSEGVRPDYLKYYQADQPVREQREAEGHAVRAVYLYTGMAKVAGHTGDRELLESCRRLFDDIVNRKMYITGGIGSSFVGEAFTVAYDLTNSSLMYAESCASIGLVYFADELLKLTGDGRYADVMERALFNGALAGISLSGDRFFYTNYLEVSDNTVCYNSGSKTRQKWFDCSCCPTNFCRFIPEASGYLWCVGGDRVMLNLPLAHRASLQTPQGALQFEVAGNYPYDGKIRIEIGTAGDYTLALRVPGWCRRAAFRLNGQSLTPVVELGYAGIRRHWQAGDIVEYELEMKVEVLRCHRKVTCNAGRIALQYGPLVYCLEGVDNGPGVAELLIDTAFPFALAAAPGLPAGTLMITGRAWREIPAAENVDQLYFSEPNRLEETVFKAIPYALWQNRGETDMIVWVREKQR
ncbi:glycoside hydrolase family 127 protein [Victivallis sp. Marseille-Q1083]|uniref:glycoside hydrolase family 127 protein n=1 Tax=Victivallis sp. Marseille-Q1083 TaxID=2717288 RepID=UPI00158BCCFD|nr:beta-L-arabinofuranosidase domain-containing protein [Victivallis sp. Marseille-Q1083]